MSDDETVELASLCSVLADDTITGAEKERLNSILRASEEARRFYIKQAALSVSLITYAAEMQSDAPRLIVMKPKSQWLAGIAVAAAVMILGFIFWPKRGTTMPAAEMILVASMTGTKDCVWSGASMESGAQLQAGQQLELTKGAAEITFDSGAQISIEGPTSLVITSAWDASLKYGTVKSKVPEEAIGFRITHPSVEVVDLGTEFSILADAAGAEVLVLKGSVEAFVHGDETPVVLKEQESRRFAEDGVSAVRDRQRKFAHFAHVIQFERAVINDDYAHWSFDEGAESVLLAEQRSKRKRGGRPKLDANANATLADGRWGKSLLFDGHLVAKAVMPELSTSGSGRTIAFWVRVPENAPIKEGRGSILGWGQSSKKHGAQSACIGWNKSPAQGPVGAIRSELGRTRIIGGTNVRDGRWHHVALVLVPDASGLLHVKQYVDGRLDGSPVGDRPKKKSGDVAEQDDIDTLWLGCGPQDFRKRAFFSGALDELFVIDHALTPTEIVRLMHENQLAGEIAQAR